MVKYVLLYVDENPQHVLVDFQSFQQSRFTGIGNCYVMLLLQAQIWFYKLIWIFSAYLHTGHLHVPLSQFSCK